MNTIKTTIAKNGQTYYYMNGKRIGQAKALALMAETQTATPANDAHADAHADAQADAQADAHADAPSVQVTPNGLPRFDFVVKQTDYVVRQELLAQRTHYISQRAEKAKATLKGMCKVSAVAFLIIAVVAFVGITSSAVTIASISALLAVSAPLMLVAYRSQTDAVDKIRAEREQCLLRVGEYANPERHLSAFTQSKVGNYNHTRLLSGV